MGEDDKAQAGFEYWASVPGGGGTYHDPEFVVNGERRKMQGFKTDAVGDFAVDFLNQQKKGQPFYLLVPFYAPHTPTITCPKPIESRTRIPSSPVSPMRR